jgi:hypothetical protein
MMALTTVATVITLLGCNDLMAPLHSLMKAESANKYLNPTGSVVVYPGGMHGWAFYDDQAGVVCTNVALCSMVSGPAGSPAGSGSAELATVTTSDGKALILADYKGVRFDAITTLSYSTYRQSVDAGNNLAIALQFNVDYDLADTATAYQGRLVYEPYQGNSGQVTQGTWQSWDAKAGRWWGTRTSVIRNGVATTNPCVQATPCSWATLLTAFPNVGVHATYGAVVLKAGSGWGTFRGNVDAFSIGIASATTTFNFEMSGGSVPPNAPDSTPTALFAALGSVSGPPLLDSAYRKDIVIVAFISNATQAQRQAVIDSIGGEVVGGQHDPMSQDGAYYVRINGGTTAALLSAVSLLHRQPIVSFAGLWRLFEPPIESYRRPEDGFGWTDWKLDPATTNAARDNWALEYVNAPLAWGCSTGSAMTGVAVVDAGVWPIGNTLGNVDFANSSFFPDTAAGHLIDHGTRVSSVLASVGNDSSGMTGMAWKARLMLRDRNTSALVPNAPSTAPSFISARQHIIAVGMASASVINLSYGSNYTARPLTPEELEVNQELRESVTGALQVLADSGKRPLVVIAAGNGDGAEARTSGTPAAKDLFPDQILVVGGLDDTGALWSGSDIGSAVEIYAPAVDVRQANYQDQIVHLKTRSSRIGTSFSAPLVSGVAVLLKDFDPTLSSGDIISLIKAGARTENGIPKLDAYGALKQAASRAGAPLCHNRVWNDGRGDIWADRASGPEKLITRDGMDYAAFVNPFHGGHRLELGFSYQYQYFPDSPHWREAPYVSASDQDYGGAYLSYAYGSDHDNKLWTERLDTADATGQQVRVRLLNAGVRTEVKNFGSQHIAGTQNPGSACILKFPIDANDVALPSVYYQDFYGYRCVGYAPAGVWQSASTSREITPVPLIAVPSPQADYVYVPVSLRARVALYGDLIEICNRSDTANYTPPRLTTDSLRRCANPYAL